LESADVEVLKALAGNAFPTGAYLALPSGRVLDAAEATALCGAYAPAARPLPITDGDGVNRWICHHGRAGKDCPRCTKAARVVFEEGLPDWHPNRDETFSRISLVLAAVVVAAMFIAGSCFWFVAIKWPNH
jgi:hypothetical protein